MPRRPDLALRVRCWPTHELGGGAAARAVGGGGGGAQRWKGSAATAPMPRGDTCAHDGQVSRLGIGGQLCSGGGRALSALRASPPPPAAGAAAAPLLIGWACSGLAAPITAPWHRGIHAAASPSTLWLSPGPQPALRPERLSGVTLRCGARMPRAPGGCPEAILRKPGASCQGGRGAGPRHRRCPSTSPGDGERGRSRRPADRRPSQRCHRRPPPKGAVVWRRPCEAERAARAAPSGASRGGAPMMLALLRRADDHRGLQRTHLCAKCPLAVLRHLGLAPRTSCPCT